MYTYLAAFLLSGVVCFVLTPLLRDVAVRRGWVDLPSEARKVHETPIPRVGGLAIAIAFFVPVLGLVFWDNAVSRAYLSHMPQVVGLVVGGIAMAVLGLVDDIRSLTGWQKFGVQVPVAALAYFLGYQILTIANPFGDPLVLGPLAFPITILWILGIMNAINLIDGLDGLASGISLFVVLTLFVLSLIYPNPIAGLTSVALAGALVGFLRYNFNPASIFMGDSGSLFIGFVLATTAISGSTKSPTVVALAIPMLALGLPLFDTSMAVLRRFIGGKPLFLGDREHVHHKLLDLGLSHRQTVLVMYGVTLLFGLGALGLVYASSDQSAFILGVFGVGTLILSRSLGYLDFEQLSQGVRYGLVRQGKVGRYLGEMQAAARAIRDADTVEAAMERLVEFARTVDVERLDVKLVVTTPDGSKHYETRLATAPVEGIDVSSWRRIEVPIEWGLDDVRVRGEVSFAWNCDAATIQLPEAPGYQWLALLLRDRTLEIARGPVLDAEGRVVPLVRRKDSR